MRSNKGDLAREVPATSSAVPKRLRGMKGKSFSASRSLVMSDSINPTVLWMLRRIRNTNTE